MLNAGECNVQKGGAGSYWAWYRDCWRLIYSSFRAPAYTNCRPLYFSLWLLLEHSSTWLFYTLCSLVVSRALIVSLFIFFLYSLTLVYPSLSQNTHSYNAYLHQPESYLFPATEHFFPMCIVPGTRERASVKSCTTSGVALVVLYSWPTTQTGVRKETSVIFQYKLN